MSRLTLFAAFALVACASPAPQPAPPSAPHPLAPAPSQSQPTPATTTTPTPPPAAASTPAPPALKLVTLSRLLDAPVHSLALGHEGRVAALGADAFVDDGKGWRKLPKPPANDPGVRIYFGRDDQPRLMGVDSAARGVYARFRNGAWERGAAEIGKLGTVPMAPLFGVLGYDDPEVVCARDRLCIIKRHTGWTMLPPPPGPQRVELCGKVAWAWDRAGVHRLHDSGWRALDVKPTFSRAEHLWAISDSDIWLAEREANRLHHFDGTAWKAEPSPVTGPRTLWATSPVNVWLAADGGIAHYDGKAWRRVDGAQQAAVVVTGRSAKEVWFAGDSGVWTGSAE